MASDTWLRLWHCCLFQKYLVQVGILQSQTHNPFSLLGNTYISSTELNTPTTSLSLNRHHPHHLLILPTRAHNLPTLYIANHYNAPSLPHPMPGQDDRCHALLDPSSLHEAFQFSHRTRCTWDEDVDAGLSRGTRLELSV